MSLQCGIVGLPNVGKSTLFNAITKAGIAAENYPFCTIEPNVGVVEVPDPRLAQLAVCVKPQKVKAGSADPAVAARPRVTSETESRPLQPRRWLAAAPWKK